MQVTVFFRTKQLKAALHTRPPGNSRMQLPGHRRLGRSRRRKPKTFFVATELTRLTRENMAVCQNLVPLLNIKIAGKWMFIPLKMVLIGIDPYPHGNPEAHPMERWQIGFSIDFAASIGHTESLGWLVITTHMLKNWFLGFNTGILEAFLLGYSNIFLLSNCLPGPGRKGAQRPATGHVEMS